MERLCDPIREEWRDACGEFLDAVPEEYDAVCCSEKIWVLRRDPETGRFMKPVQDDVPVFKFLRGDRGVAVTIRPRLLGNPVIRESTFKMVDAAFRRRSWA